jgi:hypothetical protein
MRTYLGLRPAVAIATGLTAVTIGAAIGLATPTPLDRVAPCGVVAEVEDGVATLVPASCSTADELADRLATIRDERAGVRWSR